MDCALCSIPTVANVGLKERCTSGAHHCPVLDFPASLRELGLQGEGSRQG